VVKVPQTHKQLEEFHSINRGRNEQKKLKTLQEIQVKQEQESRQLTFKPEINRTYTPDRSVVISSRSVTPIRDE
jgi:hypothetical protein